MRSAFRARGRHTRVARRSAASVVVALLTALVMASSVAAASPSWTSAVNVRVADDAKLWDADFRGRKVAVTWQEPGSGSPKVGIRTSTNSGTTFGPVSTIAQARQSAVDICSRAELNAVYARKLGPRNWAVEHAVSSVAGGSFKIGFVSPGSGVQRFPDVACAGGRVFVSWFQRAGSGDRLKVAHARRSDGVFSAPIDLGLDDETFFSRSLAVAGVQGTSYAVFARSNGDLRFKRWSIGAGPGFAVTPHATQVIGNGTAANAAGEAVIAAAGDKVAVAWFKCGGVFARVSNDRGQTWGPVRKVIDHAACFGDFGTSPRSIAIRGNRIVITYLAFAIESPGWVGLIRTRNDFATFSDDMVTNRAHDEHLVGYVTVGGATKLAAAFDRGDRIRFRRQQ
jgi:hypothetical protein